MGSLSILQVAVAGRAARERVRVKVAQIPAEPARLVREIALVLSRAGAALTHGVGLSEEGLSDQAAESRLEQVLALEGARVAPLGHPDDGLAVVTVVATGDAPLFPPVAAGDTQGLAAALQLLGALPDAAVHRVAVHVDPAGGDAFEPASLAQGYPHLGTTQAPPAAARVTCRFCGRDLDAYRTVCPGCGGVADK